LFVYAFLTVIKLSEVTTEFELSNRSD